MKSHLKLILLLLILNTTGWLAKASHYMGGEISWECLPNGNFRFILKVYRECGGITYPTAGLTMNSNSPVGNIQMRLWPNTTLGIRDISPKCNQDTLFPHIKCLNSGAQPSNQGAIEEWTYTSDEMYPNGLTINGVPPPSGWVFSYSSCCRNPCSNIIGSSSKSWYLRSIMYPYNNTNTYPCWDDSPVFHAPPATVFCMGYSGNFNPQVTDKQGDSLVFGWATPLETSLTTPITGWAAGYSYTSPLPGTLHNPNNIPANVNAGTGEISFTSHTQGAYIYCISTTAYRCGIKVAEVFREFQVVLLPCGSNSPPMVSMPGSQVEPFLYTDTFYVGKHVSAFITAMDTIPLILANGQLSTVSSQAFSPHFGTGFASTTFGCLIPPCATLSPPPPVSNVIGIAHQLEWDIGWDHYWGDTNSCSAKKGIYDFFFHFKDDFCPVPGENFYTYRIVVLPFHFEIDTGSCLTLSANGDVSLSWTSPYDPNTAFSYYILSHSVYPNGPFTNIDTILDIHQTQYTIPAAISPGQTATYQLKAVFHHMGNQISPVLFKRSIPSISAPGTACLSAPFAVSLQDGYALTDSLSWNFGTANVLSGSGAGPYMLMGDSLGTINITLEKTDSCGSIFLSKDILIHALPQIQITGSRYFCTGTPIQLLASGGNEYLWSTGDTSALLQIPQINSPITFHITVTDTNHCSDTASVHIRAIQTYQLNEICLVTNDISTNTLQVVWEKPFNQDIREYKIHWWDAPQSQWVILDSIDFQQSGLYIDTQHNPGQTQHYFAIQAEDSCGINSILSPSAATMHLLGHQSANNVILSWLPYHQLDHNYFIYIHRYDAISGAYHLIDSVPKFSINYLDLNPPPTILSYYTSIVSHFCEPNPGLVYTTANSNVVTIYNNVGIEENKAENMFLVAHDRMQQELIFQRSHAPSGLLEVTLYDMMGRSVISGSFQPDDKTLTLSTHQLRSGLYMYAIWNQRRRIQSGKIIIQH